MLMVGYNRWLQRRLIQWNIQHSRKVAGDNNLMVPHSIVKAVFNFSILNSFMKLTIFLRHIFGVLNKIHIKCAVTSPHKLPWS